MSVFINSRDLELSKIILDSILRDRDITVNLKAGQLNIVGLRKKNKSSKNFEDLLFNIIFRNNDGGKYIEIDMFDGTTTPGEYYLLNYKLSNSKGCAILKTGYYKDCWGFGYHKQDRNRPALVQIKPLNIIRDNNADNVLDYNMTVESYGLIGINFHTVTNNLVGNVLEIKQSSAGCQVTARKDSFNSVFIGNVQEFIKKGQTTFSYTLKEVENKVIDDLKSYVPYKETIKLYPERVTIENRWKGVGNSQVSNVLPNADSWLNREPIIVSAW